MASVLGEQSPTIFLQVPSTWPPAGALPAFTEHFSLQYLLYIVRYLWLAAQGAVLSTHEVAHRIVKHILEMMSNILIIVFCKETCSLAYREDCVSNLAYYNPIGTQRTFRPAYFLVSVMPILKVMLIKERSSDLTGAMQ
uniref:Uncharacterized protein n=1 Tax=Romanomermis culicivorax TaxID=13658 RepID=A0A915HVY9_ROMCU